MISLMPNTLWAGVFFTRHHLSTIFLLDSYHVADDMTSLLSSSSLFNDALALSWAIKGQEIETWWENLIPLGSEFGW